MANNITIKDAAAANVVTKTTDNTSVHTPHVNVDTSALPSGASTSANQTTIIGHLDGVEGILTTMDADTGTLVTVTGAAADASSATGSIHAKLRAAATALEVIDNAISGSEMQVDVVAALPAGTNNIGDVDVLSIIPGTGATNLGKAIGTAAGATDTGIAPLAVRDDALSTLSDPEGDFVPLRVGSTGALHVNVAAGAADFVDDAAYTVGTSGVVAVGAVATTDTVNSGDIGALAMDTDRNLRVASGASATGGMSFVQLAMAAEDNDTIVKASAGTVYFISVQSLDATPVYLKLFNAASITPGTTSANIQFMCPAAATAANGAGIVLNFPQGIAFGTGICALVSTAIGMTANTAVSANEVVVTIGYK